VMLELSGVTLSARVAPTALPARIRLRDWREPQTPSAAAPTRSASDTHRPGAGPELAGQGVLSVLIAVSSSAARS
jgi:hypothetical protein